METTSGKDPIELKQTRIRWDESTIQVFWGKVAASDHLVQIYEDERTFLNTLEGFTGDAIIKNASSVIVAIPKHLKFLKQRLDNQGFDIPALLSNNQLTMINASDFLNKVTIEGIPNEPILEEYISALLDRVGKNGKPVRIYNGTVDVAWVNRNYSSTVMLEYIWHKLSRKYNFCLFCSYSLNGFQEKVYTQCIHSLHSKIIDGAPHPSTEIHFRVA